MIRGARQVGKSTLVRNFAAQQNLTLYEINLERHPNLDAVFATFDLEMILNEISAIVKKAISSDHGILFLDEIQTTPHALQALRYFYEDKPDLPVICAGSLLEFVLLDHNFSMPVGRIEYLHLSPMSFEEFLAAKQEHYLVDFLQNYTLSETVPDSAHDQFFKLLREYCLTGGMPEAVLVYIESQQLEPVYSVHDSIIATYQDDFAKYTKNKNLQKLHTVMNYAPRSIGKKIKYTNISRADPARDIKANLDLLHKARIITKVYHSTCSGIPIGADMDMNVYKLVFLDIGLMNRMCGLTWTELAQLDGIRFINEGTMAEQFIGQHLQLFNKSYEAPVLYYWIREKKSVNAEVDYVISIGKQVIPIEVKAGKTGTLKSLLQFVHAKKSQYGLRFDANKPSIQRVQHSLQQHEGVASLDYTLLSLPLYFAEQFPRLFTAS